MQDFEPTSLWHVTFTMRILPYMCVPDVLPMWLYAVGLSNPISISRLISILRSLVIPHSLALDVLRAFSLDFPLQGESLLSERSSPTHPVDERGDVWIFACFLCKHVTCIHDTCILWIHATCIWDLCFFGINVTCIHDVCILRIHAMCIWDLCFFGIHAICF